MNYSHSSMCVKTCRYDTSNYMYDKFQVLEICTHRHVTNFCNVSQTLHSDRWNLPTVLVVEVFILRGSVAYCLWWLATPLPGKRVDDLEQGTPPGAVATSETTVMDTRSPEQRIRSTTCSCDAADTSSPFIYMLKGTEIRHTLTNTELWINLELSVEILYCPQILGKSTQSQITH